ncbi:hypothetical protein MMC25_003402 [Agyrium rufum]|nr:hypothetical protein [Agyrium rufum]
MQRENGARDTSISPSYHHYSPSPTGSGHHTGPSSPPQAGTTIKRPSVGDQPQSQSYGFPPPAAPKVAPTTTTFTTSTSPATAQSGASRVRRRNRMITSCLECRRRKLKCEKSHPCANCVKFSRDCVFLAPALDSASQMRLTEIKEKMGSLERVLERDVALTVAAAAATGRGAAAAAASNESALKLQAPPPLEFEFAPEPEDEKDLRPTPMAMGDAFYENEGGEEEMEDLGLKFGKLRVTDRLGGFFRPKLSQELDLTVRNDFGSVGSPLSPYRSRDSPGTSPLNKPASYSAPTSRFFIAPGTFTNSLIDFLPSKAAADRLLRQYWDAVHPIARLLHRPSFVRRYDLFWFEVSQGIEPIGSLQAIMFAMMYAAICTLPEEVVLNDYGVARKDLEENFVSGTETALARANVLKTKKIETMQALVMYLITASHEAVTRSHAALCSTAIRLAECMGLHRDGTVNGLTLLETHVRRLIWFQLCFLDIRTTEFQGPRPQIRKDEYDTQFPMNANDLDFEYPNVRGELNQWTEMTFTIVLCECTELHRQVWIDRPRVDKKQISLTAILGKIEAVRRTLETKYFPLVDDSIPIQYFTRKIGTALCSRAHIMVLHRYHNGVSTAIPGKRRFPTQTQAVRLTQADRLRQIIINSGTEMCFASMATDTDPATRLWFWNHEAYQSYQVALLLLTEAYMFPNRREADRIWQIVDYVFESTPQDMLMPREARARKILMDLRDRTGEYAEAKRVRTPQGMTDFMAQQPRAIGDNWSILRARGPSWSTPESEEQHQQAAMRRLSQQSQQSHHSQQSQQSQQSHHSQQYQQPTFNVSTVSSVPSVPAPTAGLVFPPYGNSGGMVPNLVPVKPAFGSVDFPVMQARPTATGFAVSPTPSSDVTMPDIDWEEWDKLFPPDVNTGELDVPSYS